jgi:hypothetical protein
MQPSATPPGSSSGRCKRLRGGGAPPTKIEAVVVVASTAASPSSPSSTSGKKRPRRTTMTARIPHDTPLVLPSTPEKPGSSGSSKKENRVRPSPMPAPPGPPAPAVLHTGAAAADLVCRWLGQQIASLLDPALGAEQAAVDGYLVRLLKTQGLLLGAVGGCCYRRQGGEGGEEEGLVGDAGLVAQMAYFLLDRRDGVAHAAGTALMGLVRAAGANPYARIPQQQQLVPLPLPLPLPVAPPALAHLLRSEALELMCRKLGDFRPEWRCWAIELLLRTLPLGAQALLLSPSKRAAVVGMLADANRDVRATAAAALGGGESGDEGGDGGRAAAAASALVFLVDTPNTHVRAAVELLEHPQLAMRGAAVRILGRLPAATQPAILAHLPSKLTSPVRGTRLFALEAIRGEGLPIPLGQDPEAQRVCLPLVLRRLGDRAPCVRRSAASVLAGLPLSVLAEWRVVDRLLDRAAGDEAGVVDPAVRAAALGAVARCVVDVYLPLLFFKTQIRPPPKSVVDLELSFRTPHPTPTPPKKELTPLLPPNRTYHEPRTQPTRRPPPAARRHALRVFDTGGGPSSGHAQGRASGLGQALVRRPGPAHRPFPPAVLQVGRGLGSVEN